MISPIQGSTIQGSEIDAISDIKNGDCGSKVEYFIEKQDSIYDVPLNELDDEIKAQIYNPTDPDYNQS